VSYKEQELLALNEQLSLPRYFVRSFLLMFLVFVLSYYVSLCYELPVEMFITISGSFL